MGATLSEQRDSKCEEDEEQHSGQDELSEDSAENKLLQKNSQISNLNGKPENQTDEMNSQSEERDLVDVGSGYVTLNEDASDSTDSIQEGDVSDNISMQMNNTDDVMVKEENDGNNKMNDTEIGFKKIFRFGGFKFTLKKDKVEKINADEPLEVQQDRNAAGPSEKSSDSTFVTANEQDEKEIKNERTRGDSSSESPETHSEMAVGKISEFSEHREEGTPVEGLMEDIPQSPEPEEPMSPIKRFFSQGILASLRKKRKEEERPKENEDELKSLEKVVEKETTEDDTTCMCLDVSNGTTDENKDIQLYKKVDLKPAAEVDIMNSLEQEKVQASPFKRLFRKLSIRRQSDTKPSDTNSLEPGENNSENLQLSTELTKLQKEQETKVVETQPADEMMDMSNEESKKKSDSAVSWENFICLRSTKTRARKTSDSEDETQDKLEMPRRITESPLESSTEGDHPTSSGAEEDSGTTWKSFKKMVTPKRKSRMEENGSVEQIQSDTEITKDESSCSLRKLISGRKKIKPDGQQENLSSDEGSKDTGTDIEDDETPGIVPLSEYEIAEPKTVKAKSDGAIESKKKKDMQPVTEEEKPKQMQPLYNDKPLSIEVVPLDVPIPTEYMEELTEFLSKHQQLSDIPEEGIVEESIATPLSFVEWTTQYDTLADDIVDMTADAVTAPEHTSEHNEDETSEMVSAVSKLSESPKTSGNVTPISPVHHMKEGDTIFQEVVECLSTVPSVLLITTEDKVPESRAVSVSQFIVESTTTTETKVLVTHKKEEAASICIGIVCKEIRAAEVVRPLPLFEGISEITHAVPTEFVSENLAEESEATGIKSDTVYKAEIKEIKTMLHEVLFVDEQRSSETARTSKQQCIMVENIPEQVSPVVQMEDVEDDSTELLNGILESTPVHSAVYDGSQLLEDQISTQNIKMPETEGPLEPALEEPLYEQLTENTQISFEVEKEHRISDVESLPADVEQLVVQITEVAKPVVHIVVASESDLALNQASAITEDITGVLVSDVKCSETTVPISSVIPISNSIKIEMDLENEAQMKNDPSPHIVDSDTIQVKANNTELQTENKNAETVPVLGTTIDSAGAFENTEMVGEVEEEKEKIEPTSTELIEVIGAEEIVCSVKAESLSEIIDKPTEVKEDEESEMSTFVRKSTLNIATTDNENAIKEPEDMPEVILEIEKEHTEADTILVEDSKRKQVADDKVSILTLNLTETAEEANKPPAISEQPGVYKEVAEDKIQPPATDNLNSISPPTYSTLITDTQTTTAAPGSGEEDSVITEAIERSSPEMTTQQETVETVKTSSEVEFQCDPDEPQTEVLLSKLEKSQATESSHEPYEENQATIATVLMSETISAEEFMKEEETGVKCNTSDQPGATLQCVNGIEGVSSLEEVKTPCVDDQSIMPETVQPVNTEIITEHQKAVEIVKTFLKVEPQPDTEQSQKENLSLNQEEIQAPKSSHEPNEENNQITGTAGISETISSVIYQKEIGVECKISDQPVENEPDVEEGPVRTIEDVTKILSKDKAESPEGFVISKTEGSEHVEKIINASIEQVSVSVHDTEMTVGSEEEIVSLDVTEQQVVSENAANVTVIANAAVTEKNTELTVALELEKETPTIISNGQTEVVEVPVVTESKSEPEVLTQEMKELKAETLEVTESKADITVVLEVQAETPIEASLITELEAEAPVVTSTEKTLNTEALALTSVINTFVPLDVTEQQVVSENAANVTVMANAAVTEKNTELTAALELKKETTTIISNGQTEVISVQVAELPVVTENKSEPEVLTQEMNELKAETLELAESKADIIVVSEVQAETLVEASLITELEPEAPVVTSTEKTLNTEALALTSVINTFQLDLKPVNEPEVSTGSTICETPILVSEIETGLSLSQTKALSPVLKEVSEKQGVNLSRPVIVEVTAPKLEMFMLTETISHTSAVPALDVQTMETSTLETETLVSTCVEKSAEAQAHVVMSIKEDTDVGSLVLTNTVSEVQLKTMIPGELTEADIQVNQTPTQAQLIQEPEMSMVAEEIQETKCETSDAVEVTALNLSEVTRVEVPGVTEQIIKDAVLTSPELVVTSAKEDLGLSVFKLMDEKQTLASCMKLPTSSEIPVVETPTTVQEDVHRPTVVPVIETVNSAVKEVEMPDVQERHWDAQASVNIDVKHVPLTAVKRTEIIEQVTEDVENTADLKEYLTSAEERSGRLKEVSVPVVKVVESGGDDDIWEDAFEDIRDEKCSSMTTSGGL